MTSLSVIEAAAVEISGRLKECGIAHALGGALSYNYFGVPRATGDIDVNVFVSVEQSTSVLECLGSLGFDINDEAMLAQLEREWQTTFHWEGLVIDFFFAYHPFHESCAARAIEMPLGDSMVPVLTAEDIVVFKVIFNRSRDWGDIERVIQVQGDAFDIDYALHWLDDILGPADTARNRLVSVHREARALR